jgi:hypothetical protein
LLIAIPVWLSWPFALPWAWIVGVSAILFGWSGLMALLMARRRASKVLGIRINGKNSPPGDRASYIAWCDRNGVTPFDASRVAQ